VQGRTRRLGGTGWGGRHVYTGVCTARCTSCQGMTCSARIRDVQVSQGAAPGAQRCAGEHRRQARQRVGNLSSGLVSSPASGWMGSSPQPCPLPLPRAVAPSLDSLRLLPSLSGQSCRVLPQFPGQLLGTCLFPVWIGKFLDHRAGATHRPGPCPACPAPASLPATGSSAPHAAALP